MYSRHNFALAVIAKNSFDKNGESKVVFLINIVFILNEILYIKGTPHYRQFKQISNRILSFIAVE